MGISAHLRPNADGGMTAVAWRWNAGDSNVWLMNTWHTWKCWKTCPRGWWKCLETFFTVLNFNTDDTYISIYIYIYLFIYTSIAVVFRDLQLKGPEWQTVERKMVEKPTALEIQLSTWRWWLFIVSIPAVPPQKWDHNTRLPQLQGSSN